MGLCGDITGEVMNMCHSDKENFIVLKQIAWNLAHICDQLDRMNDNLAEANKLNAKTIGDIVDELDSHNVKKPEKEDPTPGLKAEVSLDSLGLGDNCFICGQPLDYEKIGGVIIDGYGATYCACMKCRRKFSNMLSAILLPDEMYF